MTMYRIKVINTNTRYVFYEYGFSKWMMKRIHFLFNDTDLNGYTIFEILDISILVFTWDTLKKCLTNAHIPVRIDLEREVKNYDGYWNT